MGAQTGMIGRAIEAMALYYGRNRNLVNHALKVYAWTRAIAEGEGSLSENRLQKLLLGAVMHDIGIPEARRQFGSSAGVYQQRLGPKIARQLLQKLGAENDVLQRVEYLIANHHTYSAPGDDLQMLFEADLLVNLDEGNVKDIQNSRPIFKTQTGIRLFEAQFPVDK